MELFGEVNSYDKKLLLLLRCFIIFILTVLNSFYFIGESVEFVFIDENLSDVWIVYLSEIFSFDGNQSSSYILTLQMGN